MAQMKIGGDQIDQTTITLTGAAITPASVAASGTVTGSNLSGTNTGDQSIVLTGDATNANTSTGGALTLADTAVTAGSYYNTSITVDSKGRITDASSGGGGGTVQMSWRFNTSTTASDPGANVFRANNATPASVTALYLAKLSLTNADASALITFLQSGDRLYVQQKSDATRAALYNVTGAATDNTTWYIIPVSVIQNGASMYASNAECGISFIYGSTAGSGTVTSVAASGTQGVSISGSPITTAGTIAIGLGAITPTSVAASGTVTGSNLSGTNTGDQTIALSGDATNANTSTGGALTLATVNSNIGQFAVTTVNAKGLVTSATALTGDITSSGTATTLATVNSNVGSFTTANITVDAKGRITAAANGTGGSGLTQPQVNAQIIATVLGGFI